MSRSPENSSDLSDWRAIQSNEEQRLVKKISTQERSFNHFSSSSDCGDARQSEKEQVDCDFMIMIIMIQNSHPSTENKKMKVQGHCPL